MMITPFAIDRSYSGRPVAIVEVETIHHRKEKAVLDLAVALQLNSLYFGIIRRAWDKFHEMLIQEADRANREHTVQSQRRTELEASYNEGIRLSMSRRQAAHIKISDQVRVKNRHLDFPV